MAQDPDRHRRASALRPRVRALAREFASEREAARQIGVSRAALHKFLVGGIPYHHTLDKYEDWLGRSTDASDSTEVSEVDLSCKGRLQELADELERAAGEGEQ